MSEFTDVALEAVAILDKHALDQIESYCHQTANNPVRYKGMTISERQRFDTLAAAIRDVLAIKV